MDSELRKQLGLRKSLQILEQSASPGYRSASPLKKEAGTPMPFLPKSRVKESLFDDEPSTFLRNTSLNDSAKPLYTDSPSSFGKSFNVTSHPNQSFNSKNASFAMEKDTDIEGCSDMFSNFMQLYCNHPHSADVFELIEQYEEICRKNIKTLVSYIHKNDPTRKRLKKAVNLLNQLYQECYTWRLLGSLFRDRILSESMGVEMELEEASIDSAKSEKLIVERLFEHEASTRQCQIIVDWLERNTQDKLEDLLATDNLQFHSDSIYWEHTVHDLSQIKMRSRDPSLATNLITEVDPDAPMRQQRQLSILDQQDEEQLLLYMFRYIRAGKLEEAQNLCCEQGHFWRAASLDGWRLWHDPNYFTTESDEDILPAEGNPDRDLWKINCWTLSKEKSYSMYEKAMYAALSGNLEQLLPACNSWEDCVWAYFKVLVDVNVEQEIRNHPRTSRSLVKLPEKYWEQVQTNELTPQGIIKQIKAHPNMDIRKQCGESYRIFQTNIILNEIDDLLLELKKHLSINNAHLTRCMAHLVLFLQAVGIQTQEEICVEVLRRYVEILIEDKHNSLVAVYTARLPAEMQVDVYARFLEGIEDTDAREMYLELAEEAGLELKHITKQIVENIRSHDFEDKKKNTESDNKKINSIDWLVFDPSQRGEAIKQANAIMRGFLAERKHEEALAVFNKIPTDSIDVIYKQWRMRAGEKVLPAEVDDGIREYLCIKAYLHAHDSFNAWFDHFHHQAPVEPKKATHQTFKDQIVYEESTKEYQADFERWHKTLSSHVKSTSDCIYNVLLFPGGWMVDQRQDGKTGENTRGQQLRSLRQLCIPYLTFLLHSVLQNNMQYRDCLELATVIQSKRHNLYQVFQKQELQRFLHLMRQSSIGLLDEGCDAFGYDRSNSK